MKRNLTLLLEPETIRKARILAAKRGISISRLVSEQIDWLVRADKAYDEVSREAIDELRRGFHLGGGAVPDRAEIYDG